MRRRQFLQLGGLSALQFYVQGCRRGLRAGEPIPGEVAGGFGALEDRPGDLLDLPPGFRYVVLQGPGMAMTDGHLMPPQPDGMHCFTGTDGQWVLLRNHEIGDDAFLEKYRIPPYSYAGGGVPEPRVSSTSLGGVSRLVVDAAILRRDLRERPTQVSSAVRTSYMVLAGTDKNCAGGVVPEGWVSCEESSLPGHGYAYLTRPEDEALMAPRRIPGWGRFHREAVALDPHTGVVYMTEDRADGCLYRHVPDQVAAPRGPGRLQALRIPGVENTDPYPEPDGGPLPDRMWPEGYTWDVEWVDIADPHAVDTPCRHQAAALGATAFSRGEGITRDGRDIWFSASTGGPLKGGQIFRYEPGLSAHAPGRLSLELEVWDRSRLSCPDNLAVAPWGDLVMAEDNYNRAFGVQHQHLRAMTRDGQVYDLARNRRNESERGAPGAEFTGVCFSPDGEFLFVNLQRPLHITVAIQGPWSRLSDTSS